MIGKVVGGQYRIGALLGRGGMGEVFAAEGHGGRRAAVKFLREDLATEPDVEARFVRESKIAKTIKSPYVAAVLDSGRNREGLLWIAFELLEGESFDRRLHRERTIRFADVFWIVDDVLQGLMAAHGVNVIHRDIKPGNIFLAQDTDRVRAKILDFGVSKMRRRVDTSDHALTSHDATVGSTSYMPPEQWGGSAHVDARADLYALGVVAFLALTGSFPFVGTTAHSMLRFKLAEDALRLFDVSHVAWPVELEEFFLRTLARDPARRFSTATEARDAWRLLQHVPVPDVAPRPVFASNGDEPTTKLERDATENTSTQ